MRMFVPCFADQCSSDQHRNQFEASHWSGSANTQRPPQTCSVIETLCPSRHSWTPQIEHMTLQRAIDITSGWVCAADTREMRIAAQVREAARVKYEELCRLPVRGDSVLRVVEAKVRGARRADQRRVLLAPSERQNTLRKQLAGQGCTCDFIVALIVAQNFRCVSCKRVMLFYWFPYLHPAQFTIGRVNNAHQHVPANIVIVCLACNVARREASDLLSEIGESNMQRLHRALEANELGHNPLLVSCGVWKVGEEAAEALKNHVSQNEQGPDSKEYEALSSKAITKDPVTKRRRISGGVRPGARKGNQWNQ